ncbi:ribosome small subunit-dependent GTPase A [Methanocella sp. CWC-04]|uniref:Ribosome small subunit-dependent GTPase A n=1 Tax=Methanooceanicella nereidis TaxID=2052831 RepID=A0AAP2RET8_9EURY|nr:ribosome small subunit-dependent GTPase A [Methanocella sp. CWC-04]
MDPILKKYGWNSFFEESFKDYPDGYEAGRVSIEYKNGFKVLTKDGEVRGKVSGKLRQTGIRPSVGDWVVILRDDSRTASIHSILPRKSKFSRKDPGRVAGEQVIVTNVDHVFIVTSLNRDFNLRRLERYVAIAKESGAVPVVILSKSDICDDPEERRKEVEEIAPGISVHVISAIKNTGISELMDYFSAGNTVALLGSSGVGKSTLINMIMGYERQKVSGIREDDDRGRHTTTERELILLDGGGIIIDNPGMRELQLWEAGEGLKETFSDIEELSRLCKFSDCKHDTEPGCAIKKAIKEGTLSEKRYQSYLKLQREFLAVEMKKNIGLKNMEKKKWKQISKYANQIRKNKEKGI